jgi:hypothetical protein
MVDINFVRWRGDCGQRILDFNMVAPPGNQAVNGENKHQPVYRKKLVYTIQLSDIKKTNEEVGYVFYEYLFMGSGG